MPVSDRFSRSQFFTRNFSAQPCQPLSSALRPWALSSLSLPRDSGSSPSLAGRVLASSTPHKRTFDDSTQFPNIEDYITAAGAKGVIDLIRTKMLCKKLQPDLFKCRSWIIPQAELFTKEALDHLIARATTPVILVSTEDVKIDKKRKLYMPRRDKRRLVQDLITEGYPADGG